MLFRTKELQIDEFCEQAKQNIIRTCGGSMNGGHETLDNAEVIVNNLGQGSEAVGGAARVGHDSHAWVVRILVDSHDEHGGVGGGSGDNNLCCASL